MGNGGRASLAAVFRRRLLTPRSSCRCTCPGFTARSSTTLCCLLNPRFTWTRKMLEAVKLAVEWQKSNVQLQQLKDIGLPPAPVTVASPIMSPPGADFYSRFGSFWWSRPAGRDPQREPKHDKKSSPGRLRIGLATVTGAGGPTKKDDNPMWSKFIAALDGLAAALRGGLSKKVAVSKRERELGRRASDGGKLATFPTVDEMKSAVSFAMMCLNRIKTTYGHLPALPRGVQAEATLEQWLPWATANAWRRHSVETQSRDPPARPHGSHHGAPLGLARLGFRQVVLGSTLCSRRSFTAACWLRLFKATAALVGVIWLNGFGGRKMEWEQMSLEHVRNQIAQGLDFFVCDHHKTSNVYGSLAKWLAPGTLEAVKVHASLPRDESAKDLFVPCFSARVSAPSYMRRFCEGYLPSSRSRRTVNLLRKWYHTKLNKLAHNEDKLMAFVESVDAHSKHVARKHYVLQTPADDALLAKA